MSETPGPEPTPPVTPPATSTSEAPDAPRSARPYERDELRSATSLVLVNTGDGKGKSTAAFGTAMRSVARGWPTAVVQYLKSGTWRTGEEKLGRQVGIDWFAAGDGFTWDSTDLDETQAKAVAGWAFTRELIAAGSHRMIVLDEISYPMVWGWVDVDEVVTTLAERPGDVSLFLTGRRMPQAVIDVADTVTEMTKVKHAFETGIRARRGIDY